MLWQSIAETGMISKSTNELELYRECFGHLAPENNIFSQVLHVLEVVSSNRTGLGEVMQDYAKQAHHQLRDILAAGRNLIHAKQSEADMATLHNAKNVIRTIDKFLELTPAAMQRNNAKAIGDKEKISKTDIERLYKSFANARETALLLTCEIPEEA
jgi:hypothetical protein